MKWLGVAHWPVYMGSLAETFGKTHLAASCKQVTRVATVVCQDEKGRMPGKVFSGGRFSLRPRRRVAYDRNR
jgi:hypothetical protein